MKSRNTLRTKEESAPVKQRTKWLVTVAVVVLAAAVLAKGSYRQATGPAQGAAFQGTTRVSGQSQRQTLRVATCNIHGGKDAQGSHSLERIAECLQDLDLIALNEVRGGLWSGSPNQAETLGERVGLAWLFAPAERRWWRDNFGNGCLTSLPVTRWQRTPLAGPQRGSRRNVLWVQTKYRGRDLQVLITHLDRQSDREDQLRAVTRQFLELTEPCLLLGDLNSREDDPGLLELLATPGVRDPIREVLGAATPSRIDWILTRGLRGVQAKSCDNGASDHPCFRVELEIDEAQHASG
jgi:endonuclease/exonuclease/phosphatase family metal-dependent hydrolase